MRCTLLLLSGLLVAPILAQSPNPTPAVKGGRQQGATSERGSLQTPIVVEVVPSSELQDGKIKELDHSSPDWWMVRLTAAIAIIGAIQTIVFGVQAYRLKQTIKKMDEIAGQQTMDVQASVAEATRAATAMEGVAVSMASNVESVRESIVISREIADRQKLITELQSRAYLTVLFEGMVPQNAERGIRFEPRIRIINRGSTPAHNIRFKMVADVEPFPLRDEFTFSLPAEMRGRSSVIAPGLHKFVSAVVPKLYSDIEAAQIAIGVGQRIISWGVVRYQDAFNIDRFVEFGFSHFIMGHDQWMSEDTHKNNESD